VNQPEIPQNPSLCSPFAEKGLGGRVVRAKERLPCPF
jgi:hypothetical protein